MTDPSPSDSIEEKRVYGERSGRRDAFVAAEAGVVRASVAGGRVGEFGIERRCAPRDVAAAEGRVAVATDGDVLLGGGDAEADGDRFEATGFGPAVAVGFLEGAPLAAGPDGRVARLDGGWETVGAIGGGINAIDGGLIAAEDGVHRVGDGLSDVGLSAVRDVSAAGVPLAATAAGLYALGNGWMDRLEGDFRVVASDGERAGAATRNAFFERREGEWREVDLPIEGAVVDVAYADCPYAITADGTLLAEPEPGEWRSRALGLPGAVGLAIP